MNKICTSVEQSKKLIKLGIDRKTSDMYYWCGSDLRIGGYKAQDEELDIPAWSLTALVELLPPFIQQNRFGRYTSYWLHMTKRTIRYEYYDESYDGYDYLLRATDDNDCLLDAVCSAIVKLKEKKLL